MLGLKKCDKKFPPTGKWKQGWKWAPGARVERRRDGEMTRHRYLVTAAILASSSPPATPRSGTSRCYDGYTTQASDDITARMCFITPIILLLMWAVLRARLTGMQWAARLQDNSCNVLQVTAIYWVLVYGGMERSSGLWLAFWEANAYMSILPLSKTVDNVIVQRIFSEDIPDWPLNTARIRPDMWAKFDNVRNGKYNI